MHAKKIFKTKAFDRWARKAIGDSYLCAAAREIEAGKYEADLGRGLCKKRIALPGHGKRGSLRTLVAKQHPDAIIFLIGREKSAPGSDFSEAVMEAAKILADSLHRQSIGTLTDMCRDGALKEICDGLQEQ